MRYGQGHHDAAWSDVAGERRRHDPRRGCLQVVRAARPVLELREHLRRSRRRRREHRRRRSVCGSRPSGRRVHRWRRSRCTGTSTWRSPRRRSARPPAANLSPAGFQLSGRREEVAVHNPDGSTEGPDLAATRWRNVRRPPVGDGQGAGCDGPLFRCRRRHVGGAGRKRRTRRREGLRDDRVRVVPWRRPPSACTLTRRQRHRQSIRLSASASSGSCRIREAHVTTSYIVYIPRWTDPSRVPKPLLDWWRRIVAFIADHEAGHVQIGRDYVRRLNDRLAGSRAPTSHRSSDRGPASTPLRRRPTTAASTRDRGPSRRRGTSGCSRGRHRQLDVPSRQFEVVRRVGDPVRADLDRVVGRARDAIDGEGHRTFPITVRRRVRYRGERGA